MRQHVEACFVALDARLAQALDEAAAAAEPGSGALGCRPAQSSAWCLIWACPWRVGVICTDKCA